MLDHERNNLYFKSKTPNIELPDYYLKNCEKYKSKTVVEHNGEYMVLNPNDWFLNRTGTQSNLPFENYIPVNDWLHKYRNLHTPAYELDKFVFKTNIMKSDVFKSGLHYQMFKQMNHEWFNLLKPEFEKTYFRDILQTITQIKEKVKLIPDVPKVDYFNEYAEDIRNIKVVFIIDEISQKKNYISEFLELYPGNSEDLIINGTDQFLFLVAALTSLTSANNAHVELWKPFMIQTISKLDNYFKVPVLFVLIGEETHYLQNVIKNNPVEIFYKKVELFKSVFKLIEKKYNKKWINW